MTEQEKKQQTVPAQTTPASIFDRLLKMPIPDLLLADAIDLYIENEIDDPAAEESFRELYSDEHYQPIIRKAVTDVVIAVAAAEFVDDLATYRTLINLLELEESDEVVLSMKRLMLNKMTADATEDMSDGEAKKFLEKMQVVKQNLA